MPSLSQTALEIAVSQLGVHEQGGQNTGPEVDAYLQSVGLGPGFAWCSAFVFWCFREAAKRLRLVNPCPRVAGAVRLWTLTEPICRVTAASPGCVYILDHGHGKGHAGIIETVTADGIVECSGNTNEAGSREGNAVARHSGASPAAIHGGVLLGYLDMDRAQQGPAALVS